MGYAPAVVLVSLSTFLFGYNCDHVSSPFSAEFCQKDSSEFTDSFQPLIVQFVEKGSRFESPPRHEVVAVADGYLLTEVTANDGDANRSHLENSAIQLQCDGAECSPAAATPTDRDDWVAIVHYPAFFTFTQATVVEQVRQALLWGASAVIMLVVNADSVTKLEMNDSVTKPVVLITANITRILKALANSTRILVAITAGVRHSAFEPINCPPISPSGAAAIAQSSAAPVANLPFTTLTLWATCGRMLAQPHDDDSYPWGHLGTVCMDVNPIGGGRDDDGDGGVLTEVTVLLYGSSVALVLFVVLKAGLPVVIQAEGVGAPLHYQTYLGAWIERKRRQSRAKRALERLPLVSSLEAVDRRIYHGLGDTCSICLEEYTQTQQIRVLPCSHVFHSACVDTWIITQHKCPLCKQDALDAALGSL